MGIFNKNYKDKILDTYDADKFLNVLNNIYWGSGAFKEMELLTTSMFGIEFRLLWSDWDNYEKNEFLLLLQEESKKESADRKFELNNYKAIMKTELVKPFINKTKMFIEHCPKTIVKAETPFGKRQQFVDTEISEILEIIEDETLNFHINEFLKSTTILDMEKHLHTIQKPYYEELRKYKKIEFDLFDAELLRRRIEVFLRHGKEASDKQIKPYYDKLSKIDKIKELKFLMVDIIGFIAKIKLINKKN